MRENIRDQLKNILVEFTCKITKISDDKKAQNSAYNDALKEMKKKVNGISAAIKAGDESVLVDHFGDEFMNDLGLK